MFTGIPARIKNGNNKRLLPKMKQRKWEVHKEQAGCEQWKRKRRKQQAASKGEVLPKWEREVVVYCVQRQCGHTIQVANGKHSYIFYTSIQAITAWLYISAGYLANPWLAATCIPWWISVWSRWCTSTFWFSGIQKSTHGKRQDSWFTFHSWLPLKFAFPLLYATTIVPSHTTAWDRTLWSGCNFSIDQFIQPNKSTSKTGFRSLKTTLNSISLSYLTSRENEAVEIIITITKSALSALKGLNKISLIVDMHTIGSDVDEFSGEKTTCDVSGNTTQCFGKASNYWYQIACLRISKHVKTARYCKDGLFTSADLLQVWWSSDHVKRTICAFSASDALAGAHTKCLLAPSQQVHFLSCA